MLMRRWWMVKEQSEDPKSYVREEWQRAKARGACHLGVGLAGLGGDPLMRVKFDQDHGPHQAEADGGTDEHQGAEAAGRDEKPKNGRRKPRAK